MLELSLWIAVVGSVEPGEPDISLFMAYLHAPFLQHAIDGAIGLSVGAVAKVDRQRRWCERCA